MHGQWVSRADGGPFMEYGERLARDGSPTETKG